jgi:glycosyltransferase involved in cell wall biosynthesis
MKKLAIVSAVVPPTPMGQAIVLGKLLEGRPAASYTLIATRRQAGAAVEVLEPRTGIRVVDVLLLPVRVLIHAGRLARAMRSAKADVVVGCTGDLWELPASLLAARIARADFVPYLFDDYVHQWPNRAMRAIARRLEPLVLRRSVAVIVPNEALAEAVERRVGVVPAIVRNPVAAEHAAPVEIERGRIVFTGSIYGAQAASLRRLRAALANVSDASLHLYTTAGPEELAQAGLGASVVLHGRRDLGEIGKVLAAADVLFLPLAADGPYHPELIRTSAPGKFADYLAAGRPILADVPADSFVASYLTRYDCGVVAAPEEAGLAAALERALRDDDLRERVATNARARAAADFSIEGARAAFAAAVE